MDITSIITAVLTFITTLAGSYFTFNLRIKEIRKEQENHNSNAIKQANDLLFTQIQTELIRRDRRIEELEKKIDELEKEEWHRNELLAAEKNLNRKISNELDQERKCRRTLEGDFNKLKDRVLELEKENTLLKGKLKQIETGKLG